MSHQLYPGQKAVCVDASGFRYGWHTPPLVEGKVYVINGTTLSKCCGHVQVDVGIVSTCSKMGCAVCGSVMPRTNPTWWLRASRFRPYEPLREAMDRIEKEGAPVELETVEAIDHTHPEWCDSSELTLEELTNPALWPPFQQP